MRTITVEEHFSTPRLSGRSWQGIRRAAARLRSPRRQDLRPARRTSATDAIAEMDAAGIDVQVLSLNSPGVEQGEVAEQIALSRDVQRLPRRSREETSEALCRLRVLADRRRPTRPPKSWSARIKQLGFKGALINGHTRGRYLDDKFFWPILERAEALNAPIYLHPTVPPQGGRRRALQRVCAGRERRPGGGRLGLAHRDRGPCHSHDPRRRVRPLSEAAGRDRPPRRRAAVHAAAAEQEPAAGDDQAQAPASASTCAKTSITPLAASISRRRSSTCCSRSAPSGSCSRSTIRMGRWPRRAPSWSSFR